jgi:hypothetical protein
MAGDWMKIELELPDKPKVHAIAGTLNLDPDSVVGKLIRVWQWFDKHTVDGNAFGVTFSIVDRITGVTGFGEAMMFVGWLEQNDKNLTMPKFDKHTSQSAKQRALTAKRVEKLRNENVTVAALPREEKRREDIKPKTPSAAFALPDWIDRPTWELWIKTRKGKKMLSEQMQAQVNKLDGWRQQGIDYRKALADAAANGWSGLFEPKKPNGSSRVQEARLDVIDQIMGGLHHEHKRQVKDINPRPAIEGNGEDVSKINHILRQSDAG